jgi:hypothetical protein
MPRPSCPNGHKVLKVLFDEVNRIRHFLCTECEWHTDETKLDTEPEVKDDLATQPPTWRKLPSQL